MVHWVARKVCDRVNGNIGNKILTSFNCCEKTFPVEFVDINGTGNDGRFKAWRHYNDEWIIFDDNHITKSRKFIDKCKSVTFLLFQITQ